MYFASRKYMNRHELVAFETIKERKQVVNATTFEKVKAKDISKYDGETVKRCAEYPGVTFREGWKSYGIVFRFDKKRQLV